MSASRQTLIRVLVAAALVAVAWPPQARAGGPTFKFTAPADCPGAAAFRANLAAQLGDVAVDASMVVDVTIVRNGTSLSLTLRTRTDAGAGERTLDGSDCELLVRTAALTLAMAIAPDTVGGGDEVAADTGPLDTEDPPVVVRPADEPLVVKAPPIAGVSPDVAVRGLVGGDARTLPGAAAGTGLGVAVTAGWLRFEAMGSYWFSRRATDVSGEFGGDFSLIVTTLRACGKVLDAPATSLCLGGEWNRIWGDSFGNEPGLGSEQWLSPMGGASVAWKLVDRLYFRADIHLGIQPGELTEFAVTRNPGDDPAVVHQLPRWTVRLITGIEWRIR